ncbi:hypothetical protein CXF48_06080 [Corynebacterium bovis]|uniref:DUF4244 domain-containing protein n=2 Tax=Corynebacterium bovis TaxID=36808 RepID=A0A3R8PGZ9_9CORY|nr:hypothetical protein CXF48_06080 [Corynebacterium bovis]RRO89403.1 hypothetical protein CXF30_03355 [Corynebacterium bovis]
MTTRTPGTPHPERAGTHDGATAPDTPAETVAETTAVTAVETDADRPEAGAHDDAPGGEERPTDADRPDPDVPDSAATPVGRLRRAVTTVACDDGGMSTIEYALGMVAAAALGTLLYTVVTSDAVETALTEIIQNALDTRPK